MIPRSFLSVAEACRREEITELEAQLARLRAAPLIAERPIVVRHGTAPFKVAVRTAFAAAKHRGTLDAAEVVSFRPLWSLADEDSSSWEIYVGYFLNRGAECAGWEQRVSEETLARAWLVACLEVAGMEPSPP